MRNPNYAAGSDIPAYAAIRLPNYMPGNDSQGRIFIACAYTNNETQTRILFATITAHGDAVL
jgi:hypothetical protein